MASNNRIISFAKCQACPSGDLICEKQLFNFVDKIEKVKVDEEEIDRLLPSIFRKLEWLEKEDIIKRVVSLEFNRLIEYYRQAEEIYEPEERSSKGRKGDAWSDKKGRREKGGVVQPEKGYARLFINIGKMDGVNPGTLMGFINDHVKGKVPVGRIDLMKNFSFFEIPEELAPKVVKTFKGMYVEDRRLIVEISRDENSTQKEKKQFYESFNGKKKKKNKQKR